MINDDHNNSIFNLALNQMGVFAITDIEGRYVFVNKQWEQQTGISADFAVGRHTYDLIEGSAALLAMRTGKPVIGEMFLMTKTGRELPSVMSYIPLFDNSNESEAIGCAISSLFTDFDFAVTFNDRLESVLQEFDYLKGDARQKNGAKYGVENIIGKSKGIEDVKEQIYMAATTSATVLIQGETGTGKELVAHAIHNASLRNIFPFIKVNCSAIPENLLESEFFGYEEGSFTGSKIGGQVGKFERAHLGSIFLDEINAMNLAMQPKLLRVLQEKEIERIGSAESIPIDTRVISASNTPLKMLVNKAKFRSDLFYRLNIITINIPPLRERKEDIPILLDYFINRCNQEMYRNVKSVSGEAMDSLLSYDWPGNVRELQNVIERAMNSTWSNTLEMRHFRMNDYDHKGVDFVNKISEIQQNNVDIDPSNRIVTGEEGGTNMPLSEQKAAGEKRAVIHALEACGNNKAKTARMLGISRTMLYKKLEKYGL